MITSCCVIDTCKMQWFPLFTMVCTVSTANPKQEGASILKACKRVAPHKNFYAKSITKIIFKRQDLLCLQSLQEN